MYSRLVIIFHSLDLDLDHLDLDLDLDLDLWKIMTNLDPLHVL